MERLSVCRSRAWSQGSVESRSPSPLPKSSRLGLLLTGANSLLGQHIVRTLRADAHRLPYTHLYTLDPDGCRFKDRLGEAPGGPLKVRSLTGSLEDRALLRSLLTKVGTVVHLWELADLSLCPDEEGMGRVNAEATAALVEEAAAAGVRDVVLGSSIWTMTSTVWPSVMSPESAGLPPAAELPFPAYAASKLAAERALFARKELNSVALRLGPMFGEGDTESLVVTTLEAGAENGGRVGLMGDQGGFLQFSYAGNVAWGVLKLLQKLQEEAGEGRAVQGEVLFLVDETPVRPLPVLLRPFVEARGQSFEDKPSSFLLAYAALRLLGLAAEWVPGLKSLLPSSLPSAAFLYTHHYYWYFFSGTKARTWLDYRPPVGVEEAVRRSAEWYRGLDLARLDALPPPAIPRRSPKVVDKKIDF